MNFLEKLLERIYWWCLKEKAGAKAQQLIKNSLYAFMGVGGATLISFGFTIIAIRLLGPTEFGNFNLVVSIGEFMSIPMLCGLGTAVARHLGAEPEKQKTIIGTSFRIAILLSTFLSLALFILIKPLNIIFKTDDAVLTFAIIYAAINAIFYILQSYFQGLLKFKTLSILWVVSAFIFAIAISFGLFYLKKFNFMTILGSQLMRLATIILAGLIIFRTYLTTFDRNTTKTLLHYGTYQMFSVFAGFFALGAIDNIMINYFLGPTAVGLYAAYYMAFSVVVSKILVTLQQVVLPTAASLDASTLYTKIKYLFWKASWYMTPGIFLLIWILFKFYGPQYAFDWKIATLMALSITLYFPFIILITLTASVGLKGARLNAILAITSAVINVGLNTILIPRLQLIGAVLATICATTVALGLVTYVLRRPKTLGFS